MYDWLTDALSDEGVVVTASRRLARELRQAHDRDQLIIGHKTWQTPDIQFIDDWLDRLLGDSLEAASLPVRIHSQAATVLWEQSLDGVLYRRLPGFAGMVRQCSNAAALVQQWQVSWQELNARAAGPEQDLFASAAKSYSATLQRNSWIDGATMPAAVAAQVSKKNTCNPSRVCLAGFDRLWPSLEQLLDALGEAGVRISQAESRPRATKVSITSLEDSNSELRAAGAWARATLADNPELRVAIVCPDLQANASTVASLIREGFVPGWQYAGSRYGNAVDVSYGQSLADYPVIGIALMLLRWVNEGLSSREVSILLRSSSVGEGMVSGRCRLELALRRIPDRYWRVADLLRVLQDPHAGVDADQWHACMARIAEAAGQWPDKVGPAKWAERFDQLLANAGWPGNGSQDSEEYQLLNRWRDLLNELARLEAVLPALSCRDAVSRLTSLAADTIFQAESEGRVLPVIGALEAAGMEFDRIWVSGFDAGRWPARGHPMAYVSRQLQKDYGMPDATPQDSLAFSRRVMERLLHSADEVVLSWAQNADGVGQQASPLLAKIDAGYREVQKDPGWHALELLNDDRVAASAKDSVPPVAADERIKGGAYTVQRQVSDPFSAFAFGRLRVSELSLFQSGLSASIRGSAVHNALSHVYANKPSQSDIRSWDQQEREKFSEESAVRALSGFIRHANPSLRRIIEMERSRIRQLLMQFFIAETEREEFQVVLVEQDLPYSGNGVVLQLRVDRVDRLDDGSLLIIDYKTGAEKALLNRQGELHDLQLMVYAIAVPEDILAMSNGIGGLTLINLNSGKISLKGTRRDSEWPTSFARWTLDTEAAIKGIATGDARVNIAQTTEQGRALNVLSRFEELRRG